MAFKAAFIAHTPDADPQKDRCQLSTSMYNLFVVLVKDQKQALHECRNLVKDEGIHSVLLCPGFTHQDVAEIKEAVGENIGVTVARGDGPSTRITTAILRQEGWFK